MPRFYTNTYVICSDRLSSIFDELTGSANKKIGSVAPWEMKFSSSHSGQIEFHYQLQDPEFPPARFWLSRDFESHDDLFIYLLIYFLDVV